MPTHAPTDTTVRKPADSRARPPARADGARRGVRSPPAASRQAPVATSTAPAAPRIAVIGPATNKVQDTRSGPVATAAWKRTASRAYALARSPASAMSAGRLERTKVVTAGTVTPVTPTRAT